MPKFASIDEVMASYSERFLPEKAEGVDAVIQINLSGDRPASYVVTIKDQTLNIEEGTHDAPLLTVYSTVEDWLKLNNGEANPMMLLMQGKLRVEGPIQIATRFQTMFA